MSNELTYISTLFNTTIKQELSSLLDDFPWQSQIAQEVAKVLKESNYNLNEETIKTVLSGKLIDSEIELLINSIKKFKTINSIENIKAIVKSIFEYYQTQKIQQIFDQYSKTPNIKLFLEKLKTIPTEIASDIKIKNLGLVDPDEVYEREIGGREGIFDTNFQTIKEATPFGGYLPGQVIMVISPPGVGKSSFILQECILNAINEKSILMFILGDLMEFDMITRFISVLAEVPYYEVALNPNKYFTPAIKNVAANIDFVITPAKVLSSEMIRDIVDKSEKEYNIIVVDYDSNVRTASDNMYDAGAELYDTLTLLARPIGKQNRLVFVACQPKIQYWDWEELPEESAGESSRKQHNVDIMITLGRGNLRDGKRGGIMALPKVRRGNSRLYSPYIADETGKIREIQQSEYKLLKVYKSRNENGEKK